MANYIVGDLQGCLDELQLLMEKVNFCNDRDTLWLAGDLVARGPKSLETLEYVASLGAAAKTVLGNHDLHLLAVSLGLFTPKPKDKTAPILKSKNKEYLLNWLRHQPLLLEHPDFVLTHAGISPSWDLETARSCAREIESILQSDRWPWLIENMYSNSPSLWRDDLSDLERYRYTINALTRMRFCTQDGALDMACKLPPSEVTDDTLTPWFKVASRKSLPKTAIFGHWAALDGYKGKEVIGLDTGCVWGGYLTMLNWDTGQFIHQASLNQ